MKTKNPRSVRVFVRERTLIAPVATFTSLPDAAMFAEMYAALKGFDYNDVFVVVSSVARISDLDTAYQVLPLSELCEFQVKVK